MDSFVIAAVLVAFLVAGGVKGVLGLGLPLTSVALMSSFLDLRTAVPLLVIPIVVTNVWQALRGGRLVALLRRHWLLFAGSSVGVWFGTLALFRLDPAILLVTLGVVVCAYCAINLFAVEIRISERSVPVVAPAVGLFSGVLSGTTGSLGVPVVIYMQALGLAKDAFVQAIGLQFLITGSVWIAALVLQGALFGTTLAVSAVAIIPSVAGMMAGQWLRDRLSQDRFRTWLFVFLLVVGANLIRKGLW